MIPATDLRRAYWSALLLTGDKEGATSAVVRAILETNRSALLQRTIVIALEWHGPVGDRIADAPPELMAVMRLPEMQRHCYVLRFLEGMSIHVCGELLGISAAAVDIIAASAAVTLSASARMAKTLRAG